MNKLAMFISVPLRTYDRLRKTGYREQGFEVRSGSYNANYTIQSYLVQFPLFSYKFNTISIQLELLRLSAQKGSYRSLDGLDLLTNLKSNMNSYSSNAHELHIKTHFYN